MSEIKVNKISPRSGTTLTLGDSGDDFVIPAGATLTNNGTTSGFASIAWQSSIVTGSTLTAVAGNGYWIDTTLNACTITLPASFSWRSINIFRLCKNLGNKCNYNKYKQFKFSRIYSSPNPEYNTDGQSVSIVYSGATKGWIPTVDDDVTLETPQNPETEYLVVAGGGGGGYSNAGGGGAGGYLTNYGGSTIQLTVGEVYTVTVGSGGAGKSAPAGQGTSGSNSVLSGTGITTITAIGGGGGGRGSGTVGFVGLDGGSGGGGGYESDGGTGTVSQGNDGGNGAGNVAPEYGAGGGGGAGAVGANGTTTNGGNGGVGLSNSITGSATFYAGGGGGSANDTNASAGAGGNGGGGAGSAMYQELLEQQILVVEEVALMQSPGTTAGSGGSGIVILRLPTADYSSTTTGSPTVTTDGTDTIIKFTASGSYTA
jgi:hypothetical protein